MFLHVDFSCKVRPLLLNFSCFAWSLLDLLAHSLAPAFFWGVDGFLFLDLNLDLDLEGWMKEGGGGGGKEIHDKGLISSAGGMELDVVDWRGLLS